MPSTSSAAAPPMVPAGPPQRRRRAFRMAVIGVAAGWLVVIALFVIGLTAAPGAERSAAGTPTNVSTSHRSGHATTSPTASPTATPTVQPATQTSKALLKVPKLTGAQITETTTEFVHNPGPCAPARKCVDGGCKKSEAAPVTTTFGSVQAAFDANGIAPADDVSLANFDCAGFSYQAEQLAADGFAAGDRVAVDGKVLTLPPVAAGAPDEVAARGQVIRLDPARKTARLALLGAGEFGIQSGTVTINYVGGSTQKATIHLSDWYADVAQPGTVIAATALWNVPVPDTASYPSAPVSVYYAQIPVNPSKLIASVTLPRNPNLHFFDIGTPSPAAYATVSSAFNDSGLATPATASDSNYDGAAHSYNATALAAKGLTPHASVTAQGVTFTWPDYGPGDLDNIRTQGQTIGVTGKGSVLGFLGSSTLGTQRSTVTIQYGNGSTQKAVLTFASWRAADAAKGGTVVATVPWNQVPGAGQHQVSVYSATLPLERGKRVVSVTLPINICMHVFAIAIGK